MNSCVSICYCHVNISVWAHRSNRIPLSHFIRRGRSVLTLLKWYQSVFKWIKTMWKTWWEYDICVYYMYSFEDPTDTSLHTDLMFSSAAVFRGHPDGVWAPRRHGDLLDQDWRKGPESSGCWNPQSSAAQLNSSVLLQPRAKLLTQMSLDLWKQWLCEPVESVGGGKKGGSWEARPPTDNPLEDSAGLCLMKFQKNNPPLLQIRSPNLHISSFPQCSLWWLWGAGEGGSLQPRWMRTQWGWGGGGGGGGRSGQEEVTAFAQAKGRNQLFHVSLSLHVLLSLCLSA